MPIPKSHNNPLSSLQIVSNPKELKEVRQLREIEYKKIYPAINVYNDKYDQSAIIMYTRNQQKQVTSTARLVRDGIQGLPEDLYFPPQVAEYRHQGLSLMELGRFIIHNGNRQLLKTYYQDFYNTAINLDVDIILMAMKPKDVALHQRIMGAQLLATNMGVTYGGHYNLSCVAWEIQNTHARFFDWTGDVQ